MLGSNLNVESLLTICATGSFSKRITVCGVVIRILNKPYILRCSSE
jgi:hypothetical protein